jgi:hypothetical protein
LGSTEGVATADAETRLELDKQTKRLDMSKNTLPPKYRCAVVFDNGLGKEKEENRRERSEKVPSMAKAYHLIGPEEERSEGKYS